MSEHKEIYVPFPSEEIRNEAVMKFHSERWWGHRWFWNAEVRRLGYCIDCSVELHRLEQAAAYARKIAEFDEDIERGLYDKYYVERLDDPEGKHADCQYFVLDPAHDEHARAGLRAYIDACRANYPKLAEDLSELLRTTKWRFTHSRSA